MAHQILDSRIVGETRNPSSLPHDLIKSSLEYLPDDQLFPVRLVNQRWSGAVADCVECFLYNPISCRRRWVGTLVDGCWKPQNRKQLREVLCCIEQTTDAFQASIHAVDLSNCRFDETTTGLEWIPALEQLIITDSQLKNVACLGVCKTLKKLSFLRCYSLKSEGVEGLVELPNLEELSLVVTGVRSLVILLRCKSLKKLKVANCGLSDDGLNGVEGLGSMSRLDDLDLSFTMITNVAALSACKSLKKLNLASCSNCSGILGLESLPLLQELNLSGTSVSSVTHLSSCETLKSIDLSSCGNVSDEGIAGLEVIPTLEELNLKGTRVTSVSQFYVSKTLKKLNICDCDQLELNFWNRRVGADSNPGGVRVDFNRGE